MSNFDEQLQRMRGLMTYGKITEEASPRKNHTLEYHATAADGKTYGIVKECNKYYIKQAESGKELMAESYSYIGGFCNKKNYEYQSYSNALKNFEMKLSSINEACNGKVNVSTLNPFRANNVLLEATDKMKDEIARQRQIMYNASMLMNESTEIGATPIKDQPEAERENSGDKDAPFTVEVKPDMTFDGKKSSCPKCEGEPFDKGEKSNEKAEKGKDVQVDGSVAGMKPTGGKVVRVNESIDDKTFNAGLPTGEGTGDPQNEKFMDGAKTVNEEDDFDADAEDVESNDEESENIEFGDEEGDDTEFDDEEGDSTEFDDEESEYDEFDDEDGEVDENDPESIRAEIERLQTKLSELEDEDVEFSDDDEHYDEDLDDENFSLSDDDDEESEFGNDNEDEEYDGDEESEFGNDDDEEDIEECGTNDLYESKKKYMNTIVESIVNSIKEDTLHSFGKHPGYRKKPMTLPDTGSDKNEHGEDWNDDSVYSEEPFGSKIGDSAPFDKMVEKITNSVLESLKKK